MYVDGGNLRRIARHLKVSPQTIAYWLTDVAEALPSAPLPKEVKEAEFDAYQWLWYHYGSYEVSEGKADTYSVEADNTEFRHYLACLARKSRCFSRCPYALECALRLFVFCFNSRQLHRQRFPNYAAHVMDLVSPLF
jgi:IS1 family transposase